MTMRSARAVLNEQTDERRLLLPLFARFVGHMVKEGALIESNQVSYLRMMMEHHLLKKEELTYDRADFVEARAIATWINSLN